MVCMAAYGLPCPGALSRAATPTKWHGHGGCVTECAQRTEKGTLARSRASQRQEFSGGSQSELGQLQE